MKSVRWKITIPLLIVCAITAYTYMAAPTICWGQANSETQPDDEVTERTPLFLKDIAPILDKQGCSAGLCHGKFGGQGGLNLSLLTLNPESDHKPIVFHNRGRRINLIEPDQSLLYLKPTGQIPHAGGMRFEPDSDEADTILRWISAGAPFSPDEPRLDKLEMQPNEAVFNTVGETKQLKVIAHFTDGSIEDVTHHAVFESKDEPVAAVTENGLVTSERWGGTAVLARYLGVVSSTFITVPRESDGEPYSELQKNNFIDDFVAAKLNKLNVRPSELSSDEVFIRRIYLDTVGKLPTTEEVRTFLNDENPDKRSVLIDTLMNTPEWVDLRTLKKADMLRVHPRRLGNGQYGDRAATLFHEYIRDSVAEDKPYNQFVHEIITARGSTYQHGPTNYYRIERQPSGRAETTAQVFLGIRLSCARCHKHPFDEWTTDDYWNFAAFTGKVNTRGGEIYQELVVYHNPGGRVINQSVQGNRGQVAVPTFLGGNTLPEAYRPDAINHLADWIIDDSNPYFAKATVNRLWSYYFGRGIVDPVDDMRATTPASVEGLLEALAEEFIRSGYDTKHIIKLILNSRTYQLSAAPNETNELDDRFFSRFMPRPLMAQVLLDVLNDVTGTSQKFGRYPDGTRAIEVPLPVSSRFLNLFGRSDREFLGNLDPLLEPTLTQALHIINSQNMNEKLNARKGTITQLLKPKTGEKLPPKDLVNELYLMTLSRYPSEVELDTALTHLTEESTRRDDTEDLLWALISSRSFLFNR